MVRSGRPGLELGELGDISYTAIKNASGKVTGYRARARWRRPTDGVILPKEKTGQSKSAAKAALKKYVDELNQSAGPGSSLVTPDTKIPVLADLWLAECVLDDSINDASIRLYRTQIEPSERKLKKDGTPDMRVRPDALKVKTVFANLTVRELTAPRYAAHEAAIIAQGMKSKAAVHRVIVRGMMDLAVRHGAISPGAHPISSLKALRIKVPTVRALTFEELSRLREQLRAYSRGEAIEGGPAKTGRRRAAHLVPMLDMMLATGARPGEILGLRKCDVHRPERVGDPWVLDIFGTVKYGDSGVYRQPHTKTGPEGNRSVVLPRFAVAILLEMGAAFWDADDESPAFPTRNGTFRGSSSLSKPWNSARGEEFGWVSRKTLRKTVATIIAEEYGVDHARRQLGHRKGSKVTEQHYVDQPTLAPDSTPALERFRGEE
ncbi:tyrosine-type recombinase/integrase [Nocardia ignorata]|uniref:Tyr recombinase domain-containing protein n=1 Tax=Nocardia ignorata TaxID=145285 RepID=A0A4R6NYB1_NOCIG|nr:hypothetical protein [Nocardia ignorata]TDP29740.1 hypothetical protein DFR75_1121 [Nocardia ignorata]